MKYIFWALTAVYLLTAAIASEAGVLANQETVFNGKKNLADPAFLNAAKETTGLGATVRSLLNESLPHTQTARNEILRSLITASENLPLARGIYSDVSARQLYNALLMFDLLADKSVFSAMELSSVRNSFKRLIGHYMSPERFYWEDRRWSLGAAAMRLVACETLYSLNFPDDPDSDSMRTHAMRYFAKNLNESIDDFGGWLPDPPGITDDAVEYLVVTAKALKNAGVLDSFGDMRFISLLRNQLRLLPPQVSGNTKNLLMTAPGGETDISENPARTLILAAMDIFHSDAALASNLVWHWIKCDRPVSDLGVLFIDTTIPPLEPRLVSSITGGGSAVFRYNFGMSIESWFYTDFGDGNGFPDRNGLEHADSGDFSFVWNGNPVVVHDGYSKNGMAKRLMHMQPWRHSLVINQGAGDSPIVPQNITSASSSQIVSQGNTVRTSDFFSSGMRQFLSYGPVDYVSGDVSPGKSAPRSLSHIRHFIFLKPEALLVWDQVESSYPLEWNLWIPGENTWVENNTLHVHTGKAIDLQVLFAGDGNISAVTDSVPREIAWDWPVAMRTEYGQGKIYALSLKPDVMTAAPDSSAMTALYRNILTAEGNPSSVGLLSMDEYLSRILADISIPYETVTYDMTALSGFERYSMVIVGGKMSAPQERALYDFGWKLNEFIASGGTVVVAGQQDMPWLTDTGSGQDAIPAALAYSKIPETMGVGDNILMLHSDPVWETPEKITGDMFQPKPAADDSTAVEMMFGEIASSIPAVWSDSWRVLASIPAAFPVDSGGQFGNQQRIRVKHPASRDFMTLFQPRKIGDRTYRFHVERSDPGFIRLADPVKSWEVRTGGAGWTDANLSVMIDSLGVKTLYAFDCTYFTVGEETVRSLDPMTVVYSQASDSGVLMTATNNSVSTSRHELKPFAGVLNFSGLFGKLSIRRRTYLTSLTVTDDQGLPVGGAEVHGENDFFGRTDSRGKLPVRWQSSPPTVRVHSRGRETLLNLVPGALSAELVNR